MLCVNFLALVCPLFKHAFGLVPAGPSSLQLRRGAEKPPAAYTGRSRNPAPPEQSGKGGGTADFINNERKLGENWREIKKKVEDERRPGGNIGIELRRRRKDYDCKCCFTDNMKGRN